MADTLSKSILVGRGIIVVVGILILIDGVSGGINIVGKIIGIGSREKCEPIRLEYNAVQVMVLGDGRGRISGLQPRIVFDNSHDFDIKLLSAEMHVSFEDRAADLSFDRAAEVNIGAGTRNATMDGPVVKIRPSPSAHVIEGRLACRFRYAKVMQDGSIGIDHPFEIRGSIELHKHTRGIETRWEPDPGTSPSVVHPDQLIGVVEHGQGREIFATDPGPFR